MNFVHLSLVAGMALASIPIMLHLLGKREPKRVNFPALRFVRETTVKSQRGWSIRRWLLLILRMMLVMLLALAFASPRVHSAMLATYLSVGLVAALAMSQRRLQRSRLLLGIHCWFAPVSLHLLPFYG